MAGTDSSRRDANGPDAGPVIVLVRPQLGENIGTAARAMANFGLAEMRIVAPRDGWPSDRARSAASGADRVVDAAALYDSTEDAVADLTLVLATTARPRGMVKPVETPASATRAMAAARAGGGRAGVLFGPERTGLSNDEVALADAILSVPVNPAFASLNLAQAVLLVGYEWFNREGAGIGAAPDLPMAHTRPASKAELIGLFEHLERELDASGFLRPPEKRPSMVRNLRGILQRARLTEQDVRTLRGVVASLARTHERRRPDRASAEAGTGRAD
jgi:tRNA/rRNA methyltransferase